MIFHRSAAICQRFPRWGHWARPAATPPKPNTTLGPTGKAGKASKMKLKSLASEQCETNPCWLMNVGDYTTQYIKDYNNPIDYKDVLLL